MIYNQKITKGVKQNTVTEDLAFWFQIYLWLLISCNMGPVTGEKQHLNEKQEQ